MQPVVGEKRAQSRQAPSLRVAPSNNNSNNNNNNNTTTGSPEPAKRVITQTELNKVKDSLQDVQQFLEEAGSNHKAQILASVLEQLRGLPKITPEIQQLEKLTGMVQSIQKTVQTNPATVTPPGTSARTWANIAAGNAPTTGLNPQKNPAEEITLRPSEGNMPLRNATQPKEILNIISKFLNRASPVAARKMRSGDIRVTVTNKDYVTKNKESLQHQMDAKILREDYPVEVLAVPRSLAVQEGKDANNSALLRELSTANGKIIPGIQLTRVSWIHQQPPASQLQKTRGSLILSIANHEHQAEAVRRGVVIEGQLFQARLYDYSLRLTRCFKCSRWGHAQGHCPAPHHTCGHCGGQHDTRECQNTGATFCANCKSRSHKAWEVRDCRAYQHLKEQTRQHRVSLLYKSDSIRANAFSGQARVLASLPTFEFSSTQAGEKRKSTSQGRTAPVGRPRLFTPASISKGQTTLAPLPASNTPIVIPSTPAGSSNSSFTSSADPSITQWNALESAQNIQ